MEAPKDHGLPSAVQVIHDGTAVVAFVEALDREPFHHGLDLLLLDMHLPKCDGADIRKALRSIEHYAQVLVIVMTASDVPLDRERAQKHAVLHYFRKPANPDGFMKLCVIVKDVLLREREEQSLGDEPEPAKNASTSA